MNSGYEPLILDLFMALRREGFNLGFAELLAALRAERAGYLLGTEGIDDLPGMLALLWCKSKEDIWRLNQIIKMAQHHIGEATLPKQKSKELLESGETDLTTTNPSRSSDLFPPTNEGTSEKFGVMPTRAPPTSFEEECPIPNYHYPLNRRDMRYAWRYLRRMIPDGPRNVLDVVATIEQVSRQGFFLAPVLRRRRRNHAHLVLLLDHLGSMVPFHHYLRGLVKTALDESGLDRVDVYYFYNVPGIALYTDALLQKSQTPLSDVLASLDENSAVLIVSDAGAARCHHDLDRILATLEFLDKLRATTPHVAWLNPMPKARWQYSSADVLARYTAMFPMSREGLSHAVDALRGLNANETGWSRR